MTLDNRVVWFHDRRLAYGFVAELRRLYDLARWADVWVHSGDEGAFVEIPLVAWASVPLADLIRRFGGSAPAGGPDLDRLRAGADRARREHREWLVRFQSDRRDAGPAPAGQPPKHRDGSGSKPGPRLVAGSVRPPAALPGDEPERGLAT